MEQTFINKDSLKDYPEVLDLNQVRQILNLQSSMEVNRLLKNKEIPSSRIGTKVVVNKADIIHVFCE
jgi:hypothetical protein